CGRPHHLARAAHGAGRLLPADPPGLVRAHQAHRVSGRNDPGPRREDRREDGRRGARRGDPACARREADRPGRGRARQGTRGEAMTAFLIENIAPLMFASLVVVLLIGYPVTFALAAVGIGFGIVGIELGLLQPTLLQALPERIWGVMSNDTLLAVPFFTFMGLILER